MVKQKYLFKIIYFIEPKAIIFFLILLVAPCYSFAQQFKAGVRYTVDPFGISISGPLEPISGRIPIPLNNIKYKGSPYLNEKFELCDVLKKGIKVGSIYYRYNAYNEEIQVKKKLNADSILALQRDFDVSILFEEKELIFKEFLNKSDLLCRGYLFRLVKGEYSLFKRQNVKFTEAQKARTSFGKDVPAKFTKFKAYYLQTANKEIIEINLRKKAFLKSIDAKDKERLIKWNDFKNKKMKKESDLIDIIYFLNEEH